MSMAVRCGMALHCLLPVLLSALLGAGTGSAAAAELWLSVQPAAPAAGEQVAVGLRAGEEFDGKPRAFSTGTTAALQLYSKLAVRDLRQQLAAQQDDGVLMLTPAVPGTHMVVYDSESELALHAPGDFHARLRAHGLQQVLRQREQSDPAAPGRERLRHHAKTLLRVGGRSDGTYGLLTGQRLEIVPASDPFARRPGDTLAFTVLFDSKPLSHALVRAWHRRAGQTVSIRARTGHDGKAALTLPWAGEWMIDAVQMVPAAETIDADWDSFQSSLSFALPEP